MSIESPTTMATKTTDPILPTFAYWEMLWNVLHRDGWRLVHVSWTHPDTGAVQHSISARKGTTLLTRTSSAMSVAMQEIREATLNACPSTAEVPSQPPAR